MDVPDNFVAIVDTREQQPFDLEQFGVQVITKGLKTGDYSVLDLEHRVAIERKSPGDFLSCVGHSRERFEREIERLSEFEFAAILIEAPLDAILEGDHWTNVSPSSVVASAIVWSQRANVHHWFCPNRRYAERLCFRMLSRFACDVRDGKRPRLAETMTK